jgi:putative transcriptional regulator
MNRSVLAELRRKKGWTQEETAQKIGISRPYYALIETGKRQRKPSLFLAKKIAEVFNTSIDEIFFKDRCVVINRKRIIYRGN